MENKNKKLKIPVMPPPRDNYYLYFDIAPVTTNSGSCVLIWIPTYALGLLNEIMLKKVPDVI